MWARSIEPAIIRGADSCPPLCRQGVKGLLDNTEVTATVQRVEASGGSWAPDADIRIYSSLGVLSIQPVSPMAYALWMLGLNAALVVSQSRCKAYMLSRPLHTIPRDGLFLVREDEDRGTS